ncbi:MAG TPA: hypothetical protein VH158_03125 [Gemmatimonadales bacterium]|nr:hypothetical protein [Gemmatimonadales bacterium]
MTCHACGAAVAPAARFCHKCGAAATTPSPGWRAGLPWGIAGAALGALLAVLALRVTGDGGDPVGAGPGDPRAAIEGGTGRTVGAGGAALIDISQMSPEARAARLYNRVMTLHSQGKADSAEFFLPMALSAYGMLPALDADARHHIGVLDLTSGNARSALAQADTIRRAVPTHLFGFMLRARALELARDTTGARRAYRDFLRYQAAERRRDRPEYAEHAENLDAFAAQATQVATGWARAR